MTVNWLRIFYFDLEIRKDACHNYSVGDFLFLCCTHGIPVSKGVTLITFVVLFAGYFCFFWDDRSTLPCLEVWLCSSEL